ncbi:WD40 repeat-like protein [Panus rudis PR-1116 ss-1]|nr:WD40 repeat-like protein [Panus rudis PR-1116 ss-1]
MSFKPGVVYPVNPATTRGSSTKLSASKDKIAYTNGRTVIIRDLKNPSDVIANSGHVHNATVARISPTGYYCASADTAGNVRIWDIVGEDQTLKGEYKVLAGRVNDLEWDGESKRIIAVGDGRDKFGHAFMFDTGSSTGEIMGHNKTINAVSIRHQRPFRAATGADDSTIVFHQGAPYKYVKTIKTHTKFVQDVKYAPSGERFASVGADAKIFIYDGKEGETLTEFTEGGHGGTIFACSWSPDSTTLATASADCTVKLWDVETGKATTTWKLGSSVDYHQLGIVWTPGDDIVSVSLFGDLNVFDKRTGDKPTKILQAPVKPITTAVTTAKDTFLAGTADGRILSFSGTEYSVVEGQGHSTIISGLVAGPDGNVFSTALDDQVKEVDVSGNTFIQAKYSTASQPRSLALTSDSTLFIAEIAAIEAIRSNQKVHELKPAYTPSSIAASGSIVAVGGEDAKVRLYEWDGNGLSLKEVGVLEGNKALVSALAFSPDGALLASGDSSGKIVLFNVKDRTTITTRWSFHSARVNTLAWTADSQHCASGSLDTHVYIWSVQKPVKNIAIKNAGPGGVNAVFWLGEKRVGSAGADGCVRTWDVTFHA